MLSLSRRTRKRVIILILVPVVAYGVARVAVWYSVKGAFDHIRASLSPVASLTYTRILAPVFGPVGVTGIHLKPHVFNEEISIGSAMIGIEDPIAKLKFLHAAMSRQIPASAEVSLNDVHVPLSGDIAAWLNEKTAPAGVTAGPPAVCKSSLAPTAADLKKMGYDELAGNVVVRYVFDRRSGELGTYVKVDLQDMLEASLQGTVPPSDVVFNVDQLKELPRFSALTLSLSDPTLASRLDKYCAEAMGITASQYVHQRVNDIRRLFESEKFHPSDELMAGIENFTAGKSRLTVSLDSSDPLALSDLRTSDTPQELIGNLGVQVLFNDKPVKDLGVIETAQAAQTEQSSDQPVAETYLPTPIAKLPQFLQRRAKIFMNNGNVHQGYIESIGAGKLVVTQQLAGGSATFDVKLGDVRKVLVLRP